nr:glucose PTS transporter subunit EIIB [Anaerococcus hydrogenalis]
MLVVGIIAIAVWYFVFTFLIEKFDFKTPGREVESNVKLYSKKEYRGKKGGAKAEDATKVDAKDEFEVMADEILIGLGGAENIKDFTNCVTRLRVNVNNPEKVMENDYFKQIGTYGTSRNGKSVHVIVGTNIQYVADEFGKILENE